MAKISEFLLDLADPKKKLQKDWAQDKRGTAKGAGLTDDQTDTVVSGDTKRIERAIQKEDNTTAKVYLWIK